MKAKASRRQNTQTQTQQKNAPLTEAKSYQRKKKKQKLQRRAEEKNEIVLFAKRIRSARPREAGGRSRGEPAQPRHPKKKKNGSSARPIRKKEAPQTTRRDPAQAFVYPFRLPRLYLEKKHKL